MPLGWNDRIGTCFKIHTCHCKLIFLCVPTSKAYFSLSPSYGNFWFCHKHMRKAIWSCLLLTFITILSMMYVTKLWSILHLQHNLPHAMKGDALIIYDFLLLNFTNLLWKLLMASWTWSVLNIFIEVVQLHHNY
jgi:hypothetical protein